LITDVGFKYNPDYIIGRHTLMFVDESRTSDVFYKFLNFKVQNYSVEKFIYNTLSGELEWQLKKNTYLDIK
jgi:hypothetical protein